MPYIHFTLEDLTKKDLNSTYLTLGNIRTPIYCTETKAPPRGATEAAGVSASQAERSEEEKKRKKQPGRTFGGVNVFLQFITLVHLKLKTATEERAYGE